MVTVLPPPGKTDIDSDRTEEVVACSWDGLTFFVDHHKNFVVYKFEESVNIRAFCVGKYSLVGRKMLNKELLYDVLLFVVNSDIIYSA